MLNKSLFYWFLIWLGLSFGLNLTLQAQVVTIKEIQHHAHHSQYDGKEITTRGVVTYPTGLTNTTVFYIQDKNYGIRCFNISPSIKVGDSVQVRGKVVEYVSETEIIIDDTSNFKLLGNGKLILPQFHKIEYLHNNEYAEGTLVRTIGRVENNTLSQFIISDGNAKLKLMFPSITYEQAKMFQVGDTISVVGAMGRNEEYPPTLTPRFPYEIFKIDYKNIVPLSFAFEDNNKDFIPDFWDSIVTVTGVTTASFQLPSGGQLVHFQDNSRGASLFITQEMSLPLLGDSIIVTGKVGLRSGFEQLIPNNLTIIKHSARIKTKILKISELSNEANQGIYTNITGRIKTLFNGKDDSFFQISDETGSIDVYIPTTLSRNNFDILLTEGELVTVSGISSQYDNTPPYNDNYQLKVVRLDDIEQISNVTGKVYRNIFWALGLVIILALLAFIIIVILRKQVKVKTEEIQKRAYYLDFETRFTKGLNKNLTTKDILFFTADSISQLLNYQEICFCLYNESTKQLFSKTYSQSINKITFKGEQLFEATDNLIIKYFSTEIPFLTEIDSNFHNFGINQENNFNLCLPIKERSTNTGVIIIASKTNLTSKGEIIDVLTRMINHFAIGLKNSQLFDALERAYQDLKDAQHQLVLSEKMKAIGQLASGVAHDFNNILSIIMGMAQVILKTEPKQETRSRISSILKAAEDGAEIVSRIQEFSRMNAANDWTSFNLNEILRDVINLTESKWKSKKEVEGIKIDIKTVFGNIPNVLGNISELRTVFTNILFNSMDAIKNSGSITLTTWFERDHIFIGIEDTGMGMSDEVRMKMFEPFFTTKGIHGNGLGLSQVYGIIKRHNGTITVESELNRGTKMVISLLPGQLKSTLSAAQKTLRLKSGTHILVIEDEEEIRKLIFDMLNDHGFIVHGFTTAEEALKFYKANPIDIICSDLGLPGMSGWDFVKEIRSNNRHIPIMLLTGWGNEISQKKLDEYEINGILSKPFKIDDLLLKISDVLEK